MLIPKEIKKIGTEGLEITWPDGSIQEISSEVLRKNCPSATSLAERGDTSHEKPLAQRKVTLNIIKNTKEEQIQLEQIWAVGNYALGIRWADGHDSGIYTFELLKKLAEQ